MAKWVSEVNFIQPKFYITKKGFFSGTVLKILAPYTSDKGTFAKIRSKSSIEYVSMGITCFLSEYRLYNYTLEFKKGKI